jgi:hypothetical protein
LVIHTSARLRGTRYNRRADSWFRHGERPAGAPVTFSGLKIDEGCCLRQTGRRQVNAEPTDSIGHQLATASTDLIQFVEGGAKVSDEIFVKHHSEILANPHWVIDGFGTPRSFEDLLRAADVLVYVERAAIIHYWWVTKRFILSPFSKPLGWPARSPILRSTISSYRFLRLSYKFWTPASEQSSLRYSLASALRRGAAV